MLRIWRQFSLLFLILHPFPDIYFSCALAKSFNPYSALEVQRISTQDEIRQAYRRLVRKWHPDKNKDPHAQDRFLEINRAYKILSNEERREAYDKTGLIDDHFADTRAYENFFREQQRFQFQYVRWTPPVHRQQNDLSNFILPFTSVFGTLLFIFLIGFLLNKVDVSGKSNRRRQNKENGESNATHGSVNGKKESKDPQNEDWHPEDPKVPLTEEEKQQRIQTRIWRTMSPMIHELRAETQFGLIRLLKPGCRSIILLVDAESKERLLRQFSRHVYCLRNNKTFSFGFLVIPKNLNWFRSLLELTIPEDGDSATSEQKKDSDSVATITTDTNTEDNFSKLSGEPKKSEEKAPPLEKFVQTTENENERKVSGAAIKNRLMNINQKHTLGTVLVICGWRLYFSIYHPMHRPTSIRGRNVQLDTMDDEENEYREKNSESVKTSAANVENVLNGFPTFLERLLEGTIRRYYIPEWPENLS